MFKNLLFDWSGTLCDDLALTLEATNYVLAQYDRPALTREQFRDEFQLPYPDYYARKTPEARLVDLEKYYRHAFDHAVTQVTIIPHAKAFLEFCRSRGIRCFILTSMDPRAFDEQARFLGLKDYFEHIHSGVRNKEEYIYTLLRQHNLNPADTAFIGDMQHDINAAHCAGIIGIGVLTGYNNAAQLSVSNPDLTVPHLGALQSFMERAEPQRLVANVSLTPAATFDSMGEELERTINYDALARHLISLAQEQPTVLLETLCHRLASACVQEFGATTATVELHKFILPFTYPQTEREAETT